MLALVRYSVISVTILRFCLTLILNIFVMMPEKRCYCLNVNGDDKISLVFSKKILLIKIRIKTHLQLQSPLFCSGKITIKFWGGNYWLMNKRKKKESWESSAKNLELEDKPSAKFLIYIRNNNGTRMEP